MLVRSIAAMSAALAAGLALALSGPPRQWPALSLIAPGLLLLSLEPVSGRPARARAAVGLGLLAGLACNALSLYWIVGLLERFAGFPLLAAVPTALLLWTAQGLIFAFAATATVELARRGVPAWLALPPALCVAFSLVPSLFPWRPSASLVPCVRWVQLAEIGGEPLLDLLWGLAGTGLVEAARRALASPVPRPRRTAGPAVVGALALAVPAVYGAVRLPAVRDARAVAPVLRVGVVQPNIGIVEKHDPRLRPRHLRRLQTMTRGLERRGAELTVWPETAYPFRIARTADRDLKGARAALGGGVRGPLLFGAITRQPHMLCARWNSVVAMGPRGRIVGVSDKVRLLAFGEFVPLWEWLPPLQEYFPCRGLTPGERPEALTIAGTRVGVLNCYEDILGAETREVMRDEPSLLVNVTNDAWFGQTSEPRLHHQLARMRAIETRRDLVRSVNTGVSGHVAATGEELARTGTWTRAAFVAETRLLEQATPWVRLGDWTTPLAAGALLGMALAARVRARP